MPEDFTDEQWTTILRIANAALDLPAMDRSAFVHESTLDARIANEVLKLAQELEEPETDGQVRVSPSVGRFELLDYLGSGGAGEVYSARDPELNRTIAIKILKPDVYTLLDPEQRFLREARTASALNHPNIVTVHEIMRTESSLAIVMEFVAGEPLRRKCSAPMPESELIALGQQIAAGLAAAHAAGVIHRDIKPENVIVTPEGRVKILDFGLARFSGLVNASNATVTPGLPAGTLRYMSPEHVSGSQLSAASDVFALGVVFYEMAVGQYPFSRNSPVEVLHAIAKEEAPLLSLANPQISPWLGALIARMVHKEPTVRPSASEVAGQLKQRVQAVNVKQTIPAGAPAGSRTWVTAGALLLLLLLAGVGWKFSSSPVRFSRMEQITSLVPENHATASAISRSGKLLAYANVDGIFVRTLGTEDAAQLKGPQYFVVDELSWLVNDTGIIASGSSQDTNQTAIWSLSLAGASIRKLRTGGRLGQSSPDGSHIVFIQNDYSAIWTMNSDGSNQKRLIHGPEKDSFVMAMWSGDGRHLVFQRRSYSGPAEESANTSLDGYHRQILESALSDTGVTTDRLSDFFARSAVSPRSGELILLGGPKPGSDGIHRLWATGVDPASGRFSRKYRELKTNIDRLDKAFDMTASDDGSKIALIGRRSRESVFVADFDSAAVRIENVRELTLDRQASYPHAWSADSKAVIFESDRSGGYDLFIQALGERVPEPIVTTPKRWEVFPQLAPDGRFILYAAGPAEGGSARFTLMRVPVQGGATVAVSGGEKLEEFRCGLSTKSRCVIRTSIGRESFVYSEVDPLRGVGRELGRTAWLASSLGDWDISPDGNFLAIPHHDLSSARIRIVPLEKGAEKEHEVNLPDLANLSSVAWSADQRGWFVSVDSYSSVGRRIYYCGTDGNIKVLGPIHGWAVPSPNGKEIAYLDTLHEANVWILRK